MQQGIAKSIVELYGGPGWKIHEAEWSEYLLGKDHLEAWRRRGDPAADVALDRLAQLGLNAGDPVAEIQALADAKEEATDYASKSVSPAEDGLLRFWEELHSPPAWVDWTAVQRGQETFWRYAGPMLALLLHFSLIVGVSAPRINRVLISTGYMTSASERTFKRLLETTAWLTSIMEKGSLSPGGNGWRSCLRVRFLHAMVRRKLRKLGASDSNKYDEAAYGVPINQEDMAATILAFSAGPVAGMQRMGIFLTEGAREDYTQLWRYVGWLMGVDDDVNPCKSFGHASAAAVSIVRHLCDPDETSKQIATALLRSCATAAYKRNPRYTEDGWLSFLMEFTRLIVGNEYASAIGVPLRSSFWPRWSAWLLSKYYMISAQYLSEYFESWHEYRIARAKVAVPKFLQEMLGGVPRFLMEHAPSVDNLP